MRSKNRCLDSTTFVAGLVLVQGIFVDKNIGLARYSISTLESKKKVVMLAGYETSFIGYLLLVFIFCLRYGQNILKRLGMKKG